MKRKPKLVLGRSEFVNLTDWGITGLLAKVDTGAKTSALHVEDLAFDGNGEVRFRVILSMQRHAPSVMVTAPVIRWAKVRSSSGHFTKRCFVETTVQIGPVTKRIEISLDSREKMQYRMLLGRQALARDFLVDVAKRHGFRPERNLNKVSEV
jgi:hypothetical protein